MHQGVNSESDKMITEIIKFRVTQEVDQYGDKLLNRLDEFRKNRIFYDIMLKTTDADLPAHKVVLTACGGIFRSSFIDANTKQIMSNVTEMNLNCPSVGLHTILKFAYSGVLEITQSNLLPAFLAAVVTEMKEVQEICADISRTRLGWILKFDGTNECLSSIKRKSGSKDEQLSLEQTFTFLKLILQANAPIFASNFKITTLTNDSNKKTEDMAYPCLEEVERRWPSLKPVYSILVECLYMAKAVNQSKGDSTNALVKKVSREEKDPNIPSTVQHQSKLVNGKAASTIGDLNSLDDRKYESDEPVLISKCKDETNSQSSLVSPQEKEVANLQPPAEEVDASKFPVIKPRTGPKKINSENTLSDGEREAQKTTTPKQPFTPPAVSTSFTKSPHTTTEDSPSSSPIPPRRKHHTAPKPPTVPPPPLNKSSSSPQLPKKTPPKVPPPISKGGRSSSYASPKIPPPRPKPPSLKKKDSIEKSEDDSTNKKKETAIRKDEDYDNSLNPFAE